MIAALTRFSRPHTIIATTIQVFSLFLITVGGFTLQSSGPLLLTLIACLALNVYIVGLNQITDVRIDRVNKPNLPLASEAMSLRQGWVIVIIMGITALLCALLSGPYLLGTVLIICFIGTIYSLPPLRLKRFSFWAAVSIALARGVIANVGLALHFFWLFNPPSAFSTSTILVLTLFFFGFGLVIAIYKDIPDLLGDQMYGIHSFSVKMGPQGAFNLGRIIITSGYLAVIIAAIIEMPQPQAIFLLVTQFVALSLFWIFSSRIDPAEKGAMTRFYLFLWGLFYAQYLILSLSQVSQGLL